MFYRPTRTDTGTMWDTWLYHHQGTSYLYYLAHCGEAWDNISMARATDGVDWHEIGPVLRKGEGVTWMGTGSTWKAPAGGAPFQVNFSEWKGPRQTIFFAVSEDLVHWERQGGECEFVQDERWYEPRGRWDCIWAIPRQEGGLYGYWTATPRPETGGRFGFGRSEDGLRWEALPPPRVEGVGEGEVGAVEEIGGRYYLMFGTGGQMVSLIAEAPAGPFRAASTNRVLLAGHTYFARFFCAPDGLLVNHHSIARDGRVYMGLLKQARVDAAGTLRLCWWKGNDRLKAAGQESVRARISADAAPLAMLEAFAPDRGLILEGELSLPATALARRRGIYLEYAAGQGVALLFDAQGRAEFATMAADGSNCAVVHRVDREMAFDCPASWRLVLEHSLMEVYLDDALVECLSLPARATGRVGLINGGETGALSGLRAWQ